MKQKIPCTAGTRGCRSDRFVTWDYVVQEGHRPLFKRGVVTADVIARMFETVFATHSALKAQTGKSDLVKRTVPPENIAGNQTVNKLAKVLVNPRPWICNSPVYPLDETVQQLVGEFIPVSDQKMVDTDIDNDS